MKIRLNIEGHRKSDLLDVLRSVINRLEDGHESGGDIHPTRHYSFEAEGVPVEHYVVRENPVAASEGEDLHPNFQSALAASKPEHWLVGLDAKGDPITLSKPHHNGTPSLGSSLAV